MENMISHPLSQVSGRDPQLGVEGAIDLVIYLGLKRNFKESRWSSPFPIGNRL